jgi:hypothetical protein
VETRGSGCNELNRQPITLKSTLKIMGKKPVFLKYRVFVLALTNAKQRRFSGLAAFQRSPHQSYTDKISIF